MNTGGYVGYTVDNGSAGTGTVISQDTADQPFVGYVGYVASSNAHTPSIAPDHTPSFSQHNNSNSHEQNGASLPSLSYNSSQDSYSNGNGSSRPGVPFSHSQESPSPAYNQPVSLPPRPSSAAAANVKRTAEECSLVYNSPLVKKKRRKVIEPPDLPIPKPMPAKREPKSALSPPPKRSVKPKTTNEIKKIISKDVKPVVVKKEVQQAPAPSKPVNGIRPKKIKEDKTKPVVSSTNSDVTNSPKSASINQCARAIADIDREIAQLQNKIKKNEGKSVKEPERLTPISVECYEPQSVVKTTNDSQSPGYNPTPIDEEPEPYSPKYIPAKTNLPSKPAADSKEKRAKAVTDHDKRDKTQSKSKKETPTPKLKSVDLFSVPSTTEREEDNSVKEVVDAMAPKQRIAKPNAAQTSTVRAKGGSAKGSVKSAKQQMSMRYSQMQAEKSRLMEQAVAQRSAVDAVCPSTIATTVPKGERRKAHVPQVILEKQKSDRPKIRSDVASRFPLDVRQRCLDKLIEECLKGSVPDAQTAYAMAVSEEQQLYEKSSTKMGYMSSVMSTCGRIRVRANATQPSTSSAMSLSHAQVLGGKGLAEGSFSLHSPLSPISNDPNNWDDRTLYNQLSEYLLSAQQLVDNGFPYWDPANNGQCSFMLSKDDKKRAVLSETDRKRVCSRCGSGFRLNEDGSYERQEECVYHWGKSWKRKVAGQWDTRYTCCQSEVSVRGCSFAESHVTEALTTADLRQFKSTEQREPIDYKVYAVDCEMVYTVAGSALARVSVVDRHCVSVMDAFVRPSATLVDCNSRFSGIRPADLENAQYDLMQAREKFESLVSADTILIGHSLESDLRSLRLVHDKVVDTSVVFPHRLGPPFKRALKTLMADYMRKIIQEDVGGHDSTEDAAACMQLMIHKLKDTKSPKKNTDTDNSN